MYPVLFQIGGFQIHSFGLLMALAWLSAGMYLDVRFRETAFKRDMVSGFLLWMLAGSLMGARVLYLAVEYPSWLGDPLAAVFSRSGFVFYGGLIGGMISAILFLRKNKMPILATGDLAAPAVALGISIGRIGCFLAGDDYGKAADVPWAVTFTNPDSLAPLGVPLHPAQIYLSANAFCLFLILNFLLRRKNFDGQILAAFFILYSATRFFWEFFRGDPRGFLGPFSTSQWISLLVFPAGIWLYCRWKKCVHPSTS